MATKVKINKEVDVEAVPVVEEVKKTSAPKVEWPEVGQTGKFNAVEFKDGYVVYNPAGQRATGVVSKVAADDIVRQQNQAAQIKVR